MLLFFFLVCESDKQLIPVKNVILAIKGEKKKSIVDDISENHHAKLKSIIK